MSTALATQSAADVPFQTIERMANAVAKSQLFGVKTPEQAMALMLLAQAEGMHPAIAARDYHIISGRPALKADTMLARFQASGGKVDWKEYTDTRCVGVFSHPQAGSVSVEWTIQRAIDAGLMKNPTWKSYPRAMLRARCISEGVRTCFPGVAVGTYTVEEAQDMAAEVNVTPPPPASSAAVSVEKADVGPSNKLTEAEIAEHLASMKGAPDVAALTSAFSSAWTHASQSKDADARVTFKAAYDARKEVIAPAPLAAEVMR